MEQKKKSTGLSLVPDNCGSPSDACPPSCIQFSLFHPTPSSSTTVCEARDFATCELDLPPWTICPVQAVTAAPATFCQQPPQQRGGRGSSYNVDNTLHPQSRILFYLDTLYKEKVACKCGILCRKVLPTN